MTIDRGVIPLHCRIAGAVCQACLPRLSKPFTGKKAISQIAFYEGAEQGEETQQFRVFGGGSAAAERLGKEGGKGVELGGAFTHTDIIFRARFS